MKNQTSALRTNAVQLHPATDEWMSGDRYGAIVARRVNGDVLVRFDKSQKLKWICPGNIYEEFVRV